MSTPVVIKGTAIQLYPQQADLTRNLIFSNGNDYLSVMLQAKLSPGFAMVMVEENRANSRDEGE